MQIESSKGLIHTPPAKLTWQWKIHWDVFPIENGDFPASHVSELRGVGKFPFSIGNTSSNGGFSTVMLVFGGVRTKLPTLEYLVDTFPA